MYRVSPLTYWVSGVATTAIAGRDVNCANNGEYLSTYAQAAGGNLLNAGARSQCEYCPLRSSDQFLASVSMTYDTRWRNFGIMWAYIVFNIFIAIAFYYCFRVAGFKNLFDLTPVKKRIMKLLGKTGMLTQKDREKNERII
jgi:ATP-binding cassette, subfamily G (WHITE), member 2, PDR